MKPCPFQNLVSRIKQEKGSDGVPDFDPDGGSEASEYLFLLEAPGPKSLANKGSGIISISNEDPTARRLKEQLDQAGFQKGEVVVWNIVPWYLGDDGGIESASVDNIREARPYLDALIEAMPKLKYVVLVGQKARHSFVYLSSHSRFVILGLHHTSNQSFSGGRGARFKEENLKVLKRIRNAIQ